jgi:hypothetical protein
MLFLCVRGQGDASGFPTTDFGASSPYTNGLQNLLLQSTITWTLTRTRIDAIMLSDELFGVSVAYPDITNQQQMSSFVVGSNLYPSFLVAPQNLAYPLINVTASTTSVRSLLFFLMTWCLIYDEMVIRVLFPLPCIIRKLGRQAGLCWTRW